MGVDCGVSFRDAQGCCPAMTQWKDYPLADTGEPGQVTLRVCSAVRSPELRNSRDILVALPPGYQDGAEAHPVIYMQDGQNLFDPATSFAGDWGLVPGLNAFPAGDPAPILVGIPNTGRRRRYEYSPFRDIIHGGGGGDRYLAFVVETVKPLVDASFRTRTERRHTGIAGSSLGGLISLSGLYRYPDVFAAAGVLSPALWFADGAMLRYLEEMAPLAGGRIYLDVGTAEGEEALLDVRRLRDWLVARGLANPENLSYLEDEGAGHVEEAWGGRLLAAVPFLLGSPGATV